MSRPATVDDIHATARAMPHVTVYPGTEHKPVYQVGGKSFVFFRNPRPDAFDPDTGQRYDDVIVFWVPDEGDKLAMVQDDSSPFFTTPHFDGHLSVLLRASRVGEISYEELAPRLFSVARLFSTPSSLLARIQAVESVMPGSL